MGSVRGHCKVGRTRRGGEHDIDGYRSMRAANGRHGVVERFGLVDAP